MKYTEVSNRMSVEELEDIYKSGDKVGVLFSDGTILAELDTGINSEGEGIKVSHDGLETKEEYELYLDDVIAKADCIAVMDELVLNNKECMFSFNPFVGKYKDYSYTTQVYVGGEIADKVYRVSEDK